jgi:hypothetical protein
VIPGVVGGTVAQKGTEYAAEALGADPETARLAGNVAGFIPIGGAAGLAQRAARGKALPRWARASTTTEQAADLGLDGTNLEAGVTPALRAKSQAAARRRQYQEAAEQQRQELTKVTGGTVGKGVAAKPKQAEFGDVDRGGGIGPERPGKPLESQLAQVTPESEQQAINAAMDQLEKSAPVPTRAAVPKPKRPVKTEPMAPVVEQPQPTPLPVAAEPPRNPASGGEAGAIAADFPIVAAKAVAEKADDAIKAWERTMVDDLSDIRHFTKGADLAPEEDPYTLAILHAGRAGKIERRIMRKGGLRSIVRPAYREGLLDSVREYSLLERFEELSGRGIDKFPGGQTIADVKAAKAALETKLGPKKLAKVQNYIDGLRQYSDRLLAESKDAGLISDAAYNAIKAKNQKYVPLQRIAYLHDQLDKMTPGSNVFSVSGQDLIKGIAGSTKEVLDPIQSIIRNTYKSVSLISRNRVAKSMADLSNNPKFSKDVFELKGNQTIPEGFDSFNVLIDGRKKTYAAPELVVQAMKRMNPQEHDIMTRAMAKTSELLKAGAVTLNVGFIPANVVRDASTAAVKSEVGFTPISWLRGLGHAIFKGETYDKYLESGGAFSGYFEQLGKANVTDAKGNVVAALPDLNEVTGKMTLKKAISIANPFDHIRYIGQIIEQAPRIGVFERGLRKGKSLEGAGYIARDVTVNFSKAGTAMRQLNLWVPFLNARQQGMINVGRAIADHPARASMTLTAIVGIPVISTYLNNTRAHKDIWDDIASDEKRQNFILITGDGRDEEGNPTDVVKIPKGDVGQMFGNPLESLLEFADSRNPKTVDRLARQMGLPEFQGKAREPKPWKQLALETASDVNPYFPFEREGEPSLQAVGSAVIPPVPKAVIEWSNNKNMYTGREIVPLKGRLQEASPEEQYKADTPKVAVKVGQWLGVSPLKIQNTVGTVAGGLGRQMLHILSGEPAKATQTVSRRFVGARGGGKEEDDFKAVTDLGRSKTDEWVRSNRAATKLYEELKPMQPAQRQAVIRAKIQSKELDETGLDRLINFLEDDALGLSDLERYIKGRPVAERGAYIGKKLQSLPQDEREKTLERWIDVGIITDQVLEEMGK